MPIRLRQEDRLWMAEVTPPHGCWQSPRPMVIGDLTEALASIGCRREDIDLALRETYMIKREQDENDRILPVIALQSPLSAHSPHRQVYVQRERVTRRRPEQEPTRSTWFTG